MKKLLSLMAVCSFGAVASSSVVACTQKPTQEEAKNLTEGLFKQVIEKNTFHYTVKKGASVSWLAQIIQNNLKEVLVKENIILPKNFSIALTDLPNQKQLNEGFKNWQSNYLTGKGNSDIILLKEVLGKEIRINAKYTIDVVDHWDLDAYNHKGEKQLNKIWLVGKVGSVDLTPTNIKKALWTGMFDADDKDGKHDRQIERFENQKIDEKLVIDSKTMNEIFRLLMIAIVDHKLVITLTDINIKLTEDVFSKTSDGEKDVKDYILEKSKATIKSITVKFIY